MKKNKKSNRETNIKNTIKSILFSNREINYKNLKFSILKEILISDERQEIFEKKTFDFRKLIFHYKNEINNDLNLENAEFYFQELEKIRINRINKIVHLGNTNNLILDKMKSLNKNEEIEENWKDRGYTHIKLTNGTIEVKIEDSMQLNYQLKLLELETINNIITSTFNINVNELEKWLISIKNYSLNTYGYNPVLNKNVIFVGKNNQQLEKIFIYYCLNDGKIHIIKRIQYF